MQQLQTTIRTDQALASTEALGAIDFAALGLSPDTDASEVLAVAARLQDMDLATVADFGRDVAEHTAGYADSMLDQVRNTDLDQAGAKLTNVVNLARSLNVGPLSDKRSRLPIIGPVIDRLRLRTGNVMGRFDTTSGQIATLISEVDATQRNVQERNAGLDEVFDAVRAEHRMLGVHIAGGRVRLQALKEQAEALRVAVGNDPSRLQELSDTDAVVGALDKRIGDLQALQHSAMQSLPMIRMLQANNRMLVDKFHTIKEITVPAWKRGFMLSLALNEQKNAVQLATTIDDTTNDLLVRNAELLHRNSTATAKANQRLVIDVETLRTVQDTLIKTVQEVIQIQHDGAKHRAGAVKQIEAMRVDLRTKLGRLPAGQAQSKNTLTQGA